MSISPEPSSSRTSRAFLRRAGCSRNWRFSSPQFLRNLITSSSVFTAFTISAVDSVPPPSLSMSSKHFRAALRNSPVNSAISFAAALRCASRAAARCASLLDSAVSMASSHSLRENSPSLSVSIWASAESRRAGTSRYWRFLLPQFVRKSMTFLSALTDLTCA